MRKSKLFVFMSILTLIFLFGTSALADQCTILSGLKADEQEDVKDKTKETIEDIEPEEETSERTSEEGSDEIVAEEEEQEPSDETTEEAGKNGDEEQSEEDEDILLKDANQPPVIENITFSSAIFIPGNTYDVTAIAYDPDGDEVSYEWQISAGSLEDDLWVNPMKWTAPDEEGAVSFMVSAYDGHGGSAERIEHVFVQFQQIEMEIETGTETQIEMKALFTMEFPLVWSESGSIRFDGIPDMISDGWYFGTGDTYRNQHMKCFASFDISGFQGGEIQNATLTLEFVRGDNASFWDSFKIYSASWGPRALISSDYHIWGTLLASYPVSPPGDIVCDIPLLKQKLMEAIERGDTRFQVMFFLSPDRSNNNDLSEGWTIDPDSSLKITYTSQ